MIKAKSLHLSSEAFPTQWGGEAYNGDNICIRYRHGKLRVEITEPPRNYITTHTVDIGDSEDGRISQVDMVKSLKLFVNFDDCEFN